MKQEQVAEQGTLEEAKTVGEAVFDKAAEIKNEKGGKSKLADIKTFKKKREKEKLQVKLTDEELRIYGDQLAKVERRRTSMEIEAANTAKRLKAEIGMQIAEIARLAKLVEEKEELRDVDVEIQYNQPFPGEKTIVRLDTMETVRTDIMPTYEKEDLLINPPEESVDGEKAELILDIPATEPNEHGVFNHDCAEFILFNPKKNMKGVITIARNRGNDHYSVGYECDFKNGGCGGYPSVRDLVDGEELPAKIREAVLAVADKAERSKAPQKIKDALMAYHSGLHDMDDDSLMMHVVKNMTTPKASKMFHGQTYIYPTPNAGEREIGVAALDDVVYAVGWFEDGELKALNTPNLPPDKIPSRLQEILDMWALKRGLRKVI